MYLLVITKCHFQVLLSEIKIAKISQLVDVVLNMFTFNLTRVQRQIIGRLCILSSSLSQREFLLFLKALEILPLKLKSYYGFLSNQ